MDVKTFLIFSWLSKSPFLTKSISRYKATFILTGFR